MDTPRGTNGLHKPRKPLRRRIRRTLKRIRRPEAITLEEGLDKLAELLGLHDTRIDDPEERAAVTTVRPTEHHARSIYYAPDMDGQADPGEVIWVWIQPNLPGHPARERAMGCGRALPTPTPWPAHLPQPRTRQRRQLDRHRIRRLGRRRAPMLGATRQNPRSPRIHHPAPRRHHPEKPLRTHRPTPPQRLQLGMSCLRELLT